MALQDTWEDIDLIALQCHGLLLIPKDAACNETLTCEKSHRNGQIGCLKE